MAALAKLAKEVGEHQLDEIDKRIVELRKLPDVAADLGPEKTRTQLLPEKTASMFHENERVVRVYVKLLTQMVEEVGGDAYIDCLFEQIRGIINMSFMTMSSDDRDQVVDTIVELTDMLRKDDVDRLLMPLVEDLAQDDFLKKCLCAPLLPTAYKRCSRPARAYKLFLDLCNDPTDVVSQAASTVLPAMIANLEKVEPDLQDAIKRLALDASIHTTRLNAVVGLTDVFAKVTDEQKDNLIKEVLRKVIHDKSDEMRALLATKMTKIQTNLGYPLMKGLVKFVAALLEKSKNRVKVKTIEILPEFMRGFPSDDIPELVVRFHHLKDLVHCGDNPEKAEEVRIALATAISLLADTVPIDLYQDEYVPLIEELMLDESLKVKEALVSNIRPVVQLIGQERFATSLQEMVSELSSQISWRTRQSALNAMTLMRFPAEVVASLITTLMKDECFELRSHAAAHVREIFFKYAGDTWLINKILNLIHELSHAVDKYAFRVTAAKALEAVSQAVSAERLEDFVFPTLDRLSKDKIPAVRLNVVRCYATIVSNEYNLDKSKKDLANDKLRILARDSDFDVKRIACRSIDTVLGRALQSFAETLSSMNF